ncbi:MAG: GGDEF domain-containing protein [Rhodobacteraceae bacterium]|jgi:diguanylate cyclase (GGDEF)-like protein|nr:GGDEF domain-containing protein [Paracoccaceae bacterium]
MAARSSAAVTLDPVALGRLMPLHLLLSPDGTLAAAGPTLARMLQGTAWRGSHLSELFDLRHPRRGLSGGPARLVGERLHLVMRRPPHTGFKGQAVACAGGMLLVNLGLGIGVVDAVREHRLTERDFAPTDHAIELLYLAEAKSVVQDVLRDVNGQLEAARTAAEEQALTDTLTGLRNRRALDGALAGAVASGAPFAVVRIDLDWFKAVNDNLGHAAGDAVLQAVARALRTETRAGDTVARVGGDEFVLLLAGVAAAEEAEAIGQRILVRIAAPVPWEGREARVSASLGYVLSRSYARPDPDRLLGDADEALYASKRAGRGRITAGRVALAAGPARLSRPAAARALPPAQ